jgi:hypothetical protein
MAEGAFPVLDAIPVVDGSPLARPPLLPEVPLATPPAAPIRWFARAALPLSALVIGAALLVAGRRPWIDARSES